MTMSADRPGQGLSMGYHLAMFVTRNSIHLLTKDDWHGAEHLPSDGGFLVCPNHISHADPLAVARFLYDNGHPPYFLAKESLFALPVVGPVLGYAQQIPVRRDTTEAAEAYRKAVEAVEAGKCVVVMPESTITKDPDKWPMTGKTGAARIALATGRPVIPLAQWGAQNVRHRSLSAGLLRVTSTMRAGPPVPLADLQDGPIDMALLREATGRIMDAITTELAAVRGQAAPTGRWDLHAARRLPRGRVASPEPDHPDALELGEALGGSEQEPR